LFARRGSVFQSGYYLAHPGFYMIKHSSE